ncbi:hypothetical protein OLZ31_25060 [Enterobacter asburiae]|nr:hypothetical protein [Enterobacter asburiae]
MASNILEADVVLEVKALTRRTSWIRRTGLSLAVTGGLLSLAALASKVTSWVLEPTINGFEFDIPAILRGPESSFDAAFSGIGSVMGDVVNGPLFYVTSTSAVCYLAYFFIKVIRGDVAMHMLPVIFTVLMMACMPKVASVLIGGTSDDAPGDSFNKKITAFIDDHEYAKLMAFLQEVNPKAQPGFLPFDYVVAQAGVKEGKPEIPVIKKVIEGYNTTQPFATVPGAVRYALEMTAFGDVVTASARQYLTKQTTDVDYYADTSRQGGLIGSGLLLLGASILLWVRQISRRVSFLKTSLSK